MRTYIKINSIILLFLFTFNLYSLAPKSLTDYNENFLIEPYEFSFIDAINNSKKNKLLKNNKNLENIRRWFYDLTLLEIAYMIAFQEMKDNNELNGIEKAKQNFLYRVSPENYNSNILDNQRKSINSAYDAIKRIFPKNKFIKDGNINIKSIQKKLKERNISENSLSIFKNVSLKKCEEIINIFKNILFMKTNILQDLQNDIVIFDNERLPENDIFNDIRARAKVNDYYKDLLKGKYDDFINIEDLRYNINRLNHESSFTFLKLFEYFIPFIETEDIKNMTKIEPPEAYVSKGAAYLFNQLSNNIDFLKDYDLWIKTITTLEVCLRNLERNINSQSFRNSKDDFKNQVLIFKKKINELKYADPREVKSIYDISKDPYFKDTKNKSKKKFVFDYDFTSKFDSHEFERKILNKQWFKSAKDFYFSKLIDINGDKEATKKFAIEYMLSFCLETVQEEMKKLMSQKIEKIFKVVYKENNEKQVFNLIKENFGIFDDYIIRIYEFDRILKLYEIDSGLGIFIHMLKGEFDFKNNITWFVEKSTIEYYRIRKKTTLTKFNDFYLTLKKSA